jgi:hypothetical protein
VTEIVRVDPAAVRDLGALVASSAYFGDAREAAQAAVKIMAGAELGLGPIASMRGIDIIKGEVTLSAGAVAALVRRSGVYDYAIKRWDDSGCSIVFHRHGQVLMPVSEFGPEDARRAGLTGENYRKYPRNMYFARAMTNGARMHCPDIFVGSVYTADELGAPVEVPPEPVEPAVEAVAEEIPEAPEAPPLVHMKPISEAQEDHLKALLRQASSEGMRAELLHALLEELGMGRVRVQAGWIRGLSSEEASKLITHLERGQAEFEPDPELEL